jgi:hypothetical protein
MNNYQQNNSNPAQNLYIFSDRTGTCKLKLARKNSSERLTKLPKIA